MTRLLKDEAGYSLVEVMASILLLSIAIIPMVGMFDMGLKSATTSGNYDKARALANANLENIKTMAFSAVGTQTSCPIQPESDSGFSCVLTKNYVKLSDTGSNTASFQNTGSSDPEDMIKVSITVDWGGGKSYKTTGVVGK